MSSPAGRAAPASTGTLARLDRLARNALVQADDLAAALSWGARGPSALVPTLAGSGIIALIATVELRLGERHLLQQGCWSAGL
jgi:hypothetical protein